VQKQISYETSPIGIDSSKKISYSNTNSARGTTAHSKEKNIGQKDGNYT
jgi:hypothetical protein